MQAGAFELYEPVPPLRDVHLFVVLRPWTDVGSVGTLALTTLERHFGAGELGRLRRPGAFYDFTRYRPMLYRVEGRRNVEVPSSILRYARWPEHHDLAFLHALEPHLNGEEFVESVVKIAEQLGIRRYCQVGAMYGACPHTRPLAITGAASEGPVQGYLDSAGIRASTYEGPTSIMALATEQVRERGIGILHMLVQLPPYARLDEDHRGQETLLRVLDGLYGFGLGLDAIAQEGARQYEEISQVVQADPRARAVVRQLEQAYDIEARMQPGTTLPREVERFLQEMEKHDEPS